MFLDMVNPKIIIKIVSPTISCIEIFYVFRFAVLVNPKMFFFVRLTYPHFSVFGLGVLIMATHGC